MFFNSSSAFVFFFFLGNETICLILETCPSDHESTKMSAGTDHEVGLNTSGRNFWNEGEGQESHYNDGSIGGMENGKKWLRSLAEKRGKLNLWRQNTTLEDCHKCLQRKVKHYRIYLECQHLEEKNPACGKMTSGCFLYYVTDSLSLLLLIIIVISW